MKGRSSLLNLNTCLAVSLLGFLKIFQRKKGIWSKTILTFTELIGSLEGITTAEHIMEHIAHAVGKDPLSVRLRNIIATDSTDALVASVREKSNFDSRKSAIEKFNKVRCKNT